MDCDYALSIVKGLVERKSADAYFGSTANLMDYATEGQSRGLLKVTGHLIELTEAGRSAYENLNLSCLPHHGRAYFWDWSKAGAR